MKTECLKNYGQRFLTLYKRQGSRPSPRKRNAKRQNGCLRRPYKVEKLKAKEKRNAEFQNIARRDKKAFLSDQCKEIEKTTEWESLEISSRKLEIPREHFMQRQAQ